MKFHPDINKAPGATDAFKCIGSAYSCLKDKQKRSNYDRFGSEDGPMRQTTTRPFYSQRSGFQEYGNEDFDEIFRAFFGGNSGGVYARENPFFSRRQRRRRQEREEEEEENQQQEQQGSIFSFCLQFLPIFIIFILPSMMNFIDNLNQNPFSLESTSSYPIKRTTKVKYLNEFKF